MPHVSVSILSLFSVLCLAHGACGSTHSPGDANYAASVRRGTRAPVGALEESILAKLVAGGPGQTLSVDGRSVIIGASYPAASGRICAQIEISGPRTQSLACRMDSGWAFVPSVMAPKATAEPGK